MNINFSIEYRTKFGEQLRLNIICRAHDVAACSAPVSMNTSDGVTWHCNINNNDFEKLTGMSITGTFDYFYTVVGDGRVVRKEWSILRHRQSFYDVDTNHISVKDQWHDRPIDSWTYTSAFINCWNRHATVKPFKTNKSKAIRLKVAATQLANGETLAICGSSEQLGQWNTDRAKPLIEAESNGWSVDIESDALGEGCEFKFVILGDNIEWEIGNNRIWNEQMPAEGEFIIKELSEPRFNRQRKRFAGTLIPLFSLRSEGSFGIGDFGDLKLFTDWLAATRQRILQLLPVNDTTFTHTWIDSYPYNGVSVFALHPQYADLRQLPPIANHDEAQRMERLRMELNGLDAVDYERVNEAKTRYLEIIFQQEGAKMMRQKDYKTFLNEQKEWLNTYVDYCYKRDKKRHKKAFYRFVQFILDKQLRAAHDYAMSKGVALKGDIPIGVNRNGCDVEQNRQLFNINMQAGAPPDDFAQNGQNWGFPTYNWAEMAKDNYRWWRKRLKHMSRFYDAFRIDHVLGFFRIWEIPCPETSGLNGQFSPSLPYRAAEVEMIGLEVSPQLFIEDHRMKGFFHPHIAARTSNAYQKLTESQKKSFDNLYDDFFFHRNINFWYDEAMRKLPPLLEETNMLACAEDLGMVPSCVELALRQLHVLSLEVESMPKKQGYRFANTAEYPYLSVSTISSHDMPTMRMWWDEDYNRAQAYYKDVLGHDGEAPHPLTTVIAKEMIRRQIASPSMLTIIALQDWIAADSSLRRDDMAAERVNIPSDPHHYWRYRMHITIEKLLQARSLQEFISGVIRSEGRD